MPKTIYITNEDIIANCLITAYEKDKRIFVTNREIENYIYLFDEVSKNHNAYIKYKNNEDSKNRFNQKVGSINKTRFILPTTSIERLSEEFRYAQPARVAKLFMNKQLDNAILDIDNNIKTQVFEYLYDFCGEIEHNENKKIKNSDDYEYISIVTKKLEKIKKFKKEHLEDN